MAESITIQFKSIGRDLTATVPTNGSIKAVLILPVAKDDAQKEKNSQARKEFAAAQGIDLKPGKKIPPAVTVTDSVTGEVVKLQVTDPGPGVCYWVEGEDEDELVCW